MNAITKKVAGKERKNWTAELCLHSSHISSTSCIGCLETSQTSLENLQISHKDNTDLNLGFVNFDFLNGGMGSINYSTSVYDTNLESSMTIIGKNGSVKIGGQYMNEIEVCHIKDYVMPTLRPSNPANDCAYKGSAANHHHIIENVD